MIANRRHLDVWGHGFVVLILMLVSGCGGGGGTPADTTGNSGATTSGLVPTPGTVGGILYPSAATLRPMSAGAVWALHSFDHTGTGETGFTRIQVAAAGGMFTETDSDDPNDPTTVWTDATGQVNISASLSTGLPIANLSISGPELKSPVKANDQMVLLDRHIADIGADIDKDGKNDSITASSWVTKPSACLIAYSR